jgi:hypothetical protein
VTKNICNARNIFLREIFLGVMPLLTEKYIYWLLIVVALSLWELALV